MWDDIELLTSDDTGSGCLSIGSGEEHGTTLYQVDTLVKISSEKASFSPKLHACSSSDGFVIVVDQSVTLFDNICRSLQLHLQFDTKVDVVGLCQGGEFLLVGERSGNLHLIHVTSNQTLLTNAFVQQAPDENQCTYQDLIIEEGGAKDGKYHVFLLTYNGLFCIMDLQLTQIQEAIEKKDFIAAKEGTGDFVLSKWELDPENKVAMVKNFIDSDMIKGAKKIQLADNLLFILDTMNVLSLWDIYTLIPVWNWPCTHFEDFILTTEADSSSSVTWEGVINLKLIALTTSSNQMRNLMVYSLPTMTLLYSLEVSAVSSLVRMGISSDTIYLLEGIYENDHKSPEGSVSMIVLRCLTEALPENRLSRLLHKHKFTEAENFAISFGLDVELVYKVKSNDLLERMALCSVGTHGPTVWQQLVDEAKESLCKIQDDQFVVDYCLKAQWPTFETTQEMLNYAKVRLLKKEDKIPTTFSNGLTEVLKARAKLATFYGAFGPQKFSGNSWIEFLKNEDILKDIYLQLKEGNLFCAQFLWLRHRADFESRFNVNMLDSLLSSISTSIPMRALCLWLQSDVIPFVKRILPEGQGILAKWLEQAARNLELTDKANWPENGLEVAQVFFTSENPDSLGLISSCHCISLKDCENTEEICHLRELVNNLQELIKLYRKYNCKLALSEFEKENTTTIVFRMLDKVLAPELIPSILEKYVKLYMKEYNLEEEPLLLLYIKDMLERYSCKSASLFETSWESKAMAIIGCLSDTDIPSEFFNLQGDEALQRVLYLLQIRPIDYSSRMLFLVATSSVSPFTVGQLTFAYRRRALHCLLCLADRETIESLFKKPYEEVKCFLKCITFLAAFEMLNIPLTYESFHNSPKEGMIKGLWKNHSHEPMAVRLVTELSLEYKVYDTQLWSGLLQKLLGFNMISYLRNVLTAISNIHSLWQIPYFGRAWQRVSQIPLISASCPLNPTQLLACRESLVVLLECPVSMDLDMIGVAKQFSQLELPAFALACLLLMPHSDKRDQQLQNFLGWCNPEVILQQIDEHMNTGQLAGFACQVKGFILNHIINKKQFGILANTKYFPLLKLQVISTQKVKELVDYLVNNDSLDEASLLIMEYLKQCGKAVPLDITPCDLVKVRRAYRTREITFTS
uniref:Kinetochore associated 1 n=1 Tax=Monodelphis domestica TaxID=13616 RepID=A0A5F8H6Z2_MONDO